MGTAGHATIRKINRYMRILGIDPGLLTTGYGVIEAGVSGVRVIEAGVVKVNQISTGLALQAPFGGVKKSSTDSFKEQGAGAIDFYTKLFGWKTKTDSGATPYTEIMNGDDHIGGIMQIQPQMGPMPPNWGIYIAVDDCDGTAQKATSLGGRQYIAIAAGNSLFTFALRQ